eukprot:3694648-Rhodomonas_salina.2
MEESALLLPLLPSRRPAPCLERSLHSQMSQVVVHGDTHGREHPLGGPDQGQELEVLIQVERGVCTVLGAHAFGQPLMLEGAPLLQPRPQAQLDMGDGDVAHCSHHVRAPEVELDVIPLVGPCVHRSLEQPLPGIISDRDIGLLGQLSPSVHYLFMTSLPCSAPVHPAHLLVVSCWVIGLPALT